MLLNRNVESYDGFPQKPKVRGKVRLQVCDNMVYPRISRQLHQVCILSGSVKEEPMVIEGAQ